MKVLRFLYFTLFAIVFVEYIKAEDNISETSSRPIIIKFKSSIPQTALSQNILPNPSQRSVAFNFIKYDRPIANQKNINQSKIKFGINRIHYFKNSSSISDSEIVSMLRSDPLVEYVLIQPIFKINEVPNDALWSDQVSYMNALNFPEAWDIVKAEEGSVVIAVVDDAVDWTHEDLIDNIWSNPKEIADNGIDDDNNGFIDDIRGWNFTDNSNNPKLNGVSHGTTTATAASASTDNAIGIAGAAWNAKIMAITAKCGDSEYICYTSEGVIYAAENGADIINASYGSVYEGITIPEQDAAYAFSEDVYGYATSLGTLVVSSAGNSGLDSDYTLHLPAAVREVLSVGGVQGPEPNLVYTSTAYGISVDVYSPSTAVRTGTLGNAYTSSWGTSFGSPIAAGIAALTKTKFPNYTPAELQAKLRISTTPLSGTGQWSGKLGKGRINALLAVSETTSPSMQIQNVRLYDNGDDLFYNGETVFAEVSFVNYLNDAKNVVISLSSDNENIVILSDDYSTNSIAKNDTITHTFSFSPNLSTINQEALLLFSIQADEYNDRFVKEIMLNPPPILNHNTGKTQVSITETGNIGFTEFSGSYGQGFIYNGKNFLFEGGLIIASSPTKVSDALRSEGDGRSADFSVQENSKMEIFYGKDQPVKEIGITSITDQSALNSNKVNVTQYTYADSNKINDDFVIFKYKISSSDNEFLSDIYTGLFFDWDLNEDATDYAGFDSNRLMGYVSNSQGNPTELIGVMILSDNYGQNAMNYRSIDNPTDIYGGDSGDGFTNAEKFQFMSGGLRTGSLNATDVSTISSVGPLFINKGDTAEVAFAIVGGNSSQEFLDNADNAKKLWVETLSPNPNQAPTFVNTVDPYYKIISVEKLELDLKANDPDNDQLKYSIIESGDIAEIDESSGKFVFQPRIEFDGQFKFRVLVSDGQISAIQSFTVIVEKALYDISNAYENPFNPMNGKTQIDFQLPETTKLNIVIYNAIGQSVKNIPSSEYQPGKYTFNWNGKDDNGSMVSSGIYFISFESKFDTSVKKIAVIR